MKHVGTSVNKFLNVSPLILRNHPILNKLL